MKNQSICQNQMSAVYTGRRIHHQCRPSGTEPKIKFYFGVREELLNITQFEQTEHHLDEK